MNGRIAKSIRKQVYGDLSKRNQDGYMEIGGSPKVVGQLVCKDYKRMTYKDLKRDYYNK